MLISLRSITQPCLSANSVGGDADSPNYPRGDFSRAQEILVREIMDCLKRAEKNFLDVEDPRTADLGEVLGRDGQGYRYLHLGNAKTSQQQFTVTLESGSGPLCGAGIEFTFSRSVDGLRIIDERTLWVS